MGLYWAPGKHGLSVSGIQAILGNYTTLKAVVLTLREEGLLLWLGFIAADNISYAQFLFWTIWIKCVPTFYFFLSQDFLKHKYLIFFPQGKIVSIPTDMLDKGSVLFLDEKPLVCFFFWIVLGFTTCHSPCIYNLQLQNSIKYFIQSTNRQKSLYTFFSKPSIKENNIES